MAESRAPSGNRGAGSIAGTFYCVRVRAFTDKAFDQNHVLHDVVGDWSSLDLGADTPTSSAVSFQFTGYPDDVSCTDIQPYPSCTTEYPQTGDYLGPQEGSTVDQTPVLHLEPDPRAPRDTSCSSRATRTSRR